MLHNKVILTDVDGTLLDFAGPFQSWMENLGFTPRCHLYRTYGISDVFDCTIDEKVREISRFSEADEFGFLQPILGAHTVIRSLREAGWHIVAITASHVSEASCARRRANLKALFDIEPYDVFFAGNTIPKSAILHRFGPSLWVEDSPFHLMEGVDAGHHSFLIDKPYNRDAVLSNALVTRVNNWFDIEQWINTYKDGS
jgi:hypothetical protein